MRPDATEAEWEDYLEQVRLQMALIDRLELRFKRIVWELGFDPVRVRQMLAQQRQEARLRARSARS